jgi:hypothetical protein
MVGLGSIGTIVSGAGGRYPTALWGLTELRSIAGKDFARKPRGDGRRNGNKTAWAKAWANRGRTQGSAEGRGLVSVCAGRESGDWQARGQLLGMPPGH